MNKRKFLKIVGGGAVFAAVAGGTGIAVIGSRKPKTALLPWQMAGSAYSEPRRRALSYALLAPNPHNRQPWLVDLSLEDKIILKADKDRMLPHTDPFNRQITIGLGCFLELLRMAGAEDGYRMEITEFPEGSNIKQLDERAIAEIVMVKDKKIQKDLLFAHVLERRSLKKPFDMDKEVESDILEMLKNVVNENIISGATNAPDMVRELRAITGEAMNIELITPRTYKESVDLFRIGAREVDANPDGIAFHGALFENLSALGMFTREEALDKKSTTYKGAISALMANIDSAMGYVWLVTETNTRLDQLNAGRDWLRINLAATGAGVGLHPLSQALQEYGEMEQIYARLHSYLDASNKTVQMLGRLGYASATPPVPRWMLEEKII